jgi:hypothetical protein
MSQGPDKSSVGSLGYRATADFKCVEHRIQNGKTE